MSRASWQHRRQSPPQPSGVPRGLCSLAPEPFFMGECLETTGLRRTPRGASRAPSPQNRHAQAGRAAIQRTWGACGTFLIRQKIARGLWRTAVPQKRLLFFPFADAPHSFLGSSDAPSTAGSSRERPARSNGRELNLARKKFIQRAEIRRRDVTC